MSAKTDAERLLDMLHYAEESESLMAGRSRLDLDTDLAFRYAQQYCVLIIGEAASQVSESTRARVPEIPWPAIIGMRNWLVHGYVRINLDTLWTTAERDIPDLASKLLQIIPPEQT